MNRVLRKLLSLFRRRTLQYTSDSAPTNLGPNTVASLTDTPTVHHQIGIFSNVGSVSVYGGTFIILVASMQLVSLSPLASRLINKGLQDQLRLNKK